MGLLPELSSGKQRRAEFAIIDDSSKVGSQSSWKIQDSHRIGKRFPDEVYHRRRARQYAPDHLHPGLRPPPILCSADLQSSRERERLGKPGSTPPKSIWVNRIFENDHRDRRKENARFLMHFTLVFAKFRG
jgi:hypothetical protein